MPNPDPQRQEELRTLIQDFLKKRLDDKLDSLKEDTEEGLASRAERREKFEFTTWLADAAQRVSQIQAVTHSLKPVHPDAKGTNLYSPPADLPAQTVVGSHCLGSDFADDVVGNAAALDVYKLLKLTHQGQSLLELMLIKDEDLSAALSNDPATADDWMSAFAGITQARGKPASHTNAKQLYWLTGNDAQDDSHFHLLAPLYASSLAHQVYLTINSHRFGETVKTTRKARKDGVFSDLVLHDYPQMAIQKLGGTKPQNISQLNSERRGDNCLLASLPPVWKSADLTPLLGSDSLFRRFERRTEVRRLLKALLAYLKTDPARNIETRRRIDEAVNAVIDELLQFVAELRTLPPGWSQQPGCELKPAEKHWLDPDGVAAAAKLAEQPLPTDSAERVSSTFANWLNAQLRDPLPMGDDEFAHWRGLLLEEIQADAWEGAHDD